MQQQFKFVIPQKLEDLLHPLEDPNIYYVNDELTARELNERLPQTEDDLRNDPLCIVKEFEALFSVLKNFKDYDPSIINRTWTLLHRTTSSLKEQLRELFNVLNDSVGSQGLNQSQSNLNSSQASIDHNRANLFESLQERLNYSNAIKMLVYLACSFINNFEDSLTAENHRQNFNETVIEGQTPARRKKRPRAQDNNGRNASTFKDYDRYKEKLIKDLVQLISMPLHKVADSPTEAREIVTQIMRVCYKLIENSAINNLPKQKDLMEYTFSIIGLGIEKYNQSLTFCLKFIQLLQYREQLAPLLAELVEYIVTRHGQRLLIGEILREIDRIDIRELSRDSSCPRAVSTFLVSLSEKCPQEFIPSLDHIFAYLEQDSYMMRNASLSIISNIILDVLKDSEDQIKLRDELLDVLLAHIKDIVGYTRSKALNVWCNLCDNKCIPLTYVERVTSAAVGRLRDKSCFVRKSAVRFIISILSNNPYSQRLPLDVFVKQYEHEKAILDKLLLEDDKREHEQNPDQEQIDPVIRKQGGDEGTESDTSEGNASESTITSQSDPHRVHPSSKFVARRQSVVPLDSEIEAQKRKVNYLTQTIAFTSLITKAIPIMTELLTSKNVTDIQEAIDFFVYCHEFGIDEALIGFKKMISLINVQEKSVQDAVSKAYERIFFESVLYQGKSNRDALVVKNLINFVQTASIGECLSLEVLLGQFLQKGDITKEMKDELWAWFTRAKPGASIEMSAMAIQIIGMLATYQPEIINRNFPLCVEYGLAFPGNTDAESRLVRETCFAIRKTLPRKIEERHRTIRLASDEDLFIRLESILTGSMSDMNSVNWFSMCDEAIRIIFDMAEGPEKICEKIYETMANNLLANAVQSHTLLGQERTDLQSPDFQFQPSTIQGTTCTINGTQTPSSQTQVVPTSNLELVNPIMLSRFIHFVGCVALGLAVFLELHVLLELKIRNTNPSDDSANNISAHNISISSRRRSRRYGASGNKSMDEQNLEEEIGLGGAEAEDADLEFIASICDEEIVCGKNLLAKFSRVIIEVVTDPFRYPNHELKKASSLALAKYMMVSAKYCNDHLRLLFTILEKTNSPEIKINLIIAISDLCIRFPNQLDGWNGKIFDCLHSKEVAVRRVALKILSRLVLCDILKAKDQISAMANLIVDEDEHIAAYSRHFFLELSKKLNAVYNVLPDIISRLSDPKTGINEENFRIVMRFLFELIDKSAHIERLVDKLCGRFLDTDDERQWSDLAYCLSLLKYTDKSMVKLHDKFDCYKDKLCIDSVRESITSIVVNYRKTPHLKNELKQVLDEFEARITKAAGEQSDKEASQEDGATQPDANQEERMDDEGQGEDKEKPTETGPEVAEDETQMEVDPTDDDDASDDATETEEDE